MTSADRRTLAAQVGADPFEYARRTSYWRSATERLCGTDTVATLVVLADQPLGTRVVLVPFARLMPSGGHIAAALLLDVICRSDVVRAPPARIVVVPDNVATREGYCALKISASELRGLMDAWRVRAAARGHSPGDYTPVEKSLVRRLQRKATLPEVESLHLFFPGFRYTTAGELVSIGSRGHLRAEDDQAVVLFTDTLDVPQLSPGQPYPTPDWIIIDCRGAGGELDMSGFERLMQSLPTARIAWLLPGMGHHLFNKLRGRGARVCWLETRSGPPAGTAASSSPQMASPLSWTGVGWHGDTEDLDRLQVLLFEARKLLRPKSLPESWLAFRSLRHATLLLTSLPVQSRYYDAAAIERYGVLTTREVLEDLSHRELRLAGLDSVLAAIMEEAHAILTATAGTSDEHNPRQRAVIEAVESAIGSGESLLLVVHGRTMRSAVESLLADALRTNLADLTAVGVQIETTRDLARHENGRPSVTLWTTYSGAFDLDVLLGLGGTRTTLLLNRLERELLASDFARWSNRAGATQQGTESLGIPAPGTRAAISELESFAATLRLAARAAGTPATPQDWEHLFEDDTAPTHATRAAIATDSPAALRPALRVTFATAGLAAYFPDQGMLTVLRSGQGEPTEVGPRELRPGDQIVFVDKAVGRTLYELMQDQLTQSPTLGAAAKLVGLWHRAIAEGHRRTDLSTDDILHRLQGRGSKITTPQTVRMWIRGVVLGPRDLADVDRFADILGIARKDPGILDNIKRSLAGLRTVYRTFAKIVYRTILTAGSGGQLSDAEERLIEEHGLTLRDIRRAVSIETVLAVAGEAELVPAQLIGIQVQESGRA